MATRWCGVDPNLPPQRQEKAEQLLTYRLNLGISALHSNASAVDVIELAIPSFIIM
jgi:beta-aspartyl-peptidase (threonine type)